MHAFEIGGALVAVLLVVAGCGSKTTPPPRAPETVAPADSLPAVIVAGPPRLVGDRYLFTYADPDAETVTLAGTFNGWLPSQHPMQRQGDVWHLLVEIPRGRHRYKFLVDGLRWVEDPDNPKKSRDEFGGYASVLWVP